ncbi:hypothetical protein A0H81_10375 [Grifola frondosa]|uniref:Uncharacterized protein n=1 Tax=Grifola frondosa TaxID=5627 RepID=A0A1C7M0C4_GRIFR|nr:hypothetical protein A0H81_10375 [Grifola frondosa]
MGIMPMLPHPDSCSPDAGIPCAKAAWVMDTDSGPTYTAQCAVTNPYSGFPIPLVIEDANVVAALLMRVYPLPLGKHMVKTEALVNGFPVAGRPYTILRHTSTPMIHDVTIRSHSILI